MTLRVVVCGTSALDVPFPDCANAVEHTPCPSGYVAWFEWCANQAYQRKRQQRCPKCHQYVIWR